MFRLHRFAVRRAARLAAVIAVVGTMAWHMPGLSWAQFAPAENTDPAAAGPFSDPLFAQLMDQMRQGMEQMQQSGLDSQQVLQQMIVQNMDADGNIDRAGLMQQMLDTGLIKQDMADHVNDARKTRFVEGLRGELACSDDEWVVVQAKIDAVVVAQMDVEIAEKNGVAARLGANSASAMVKAHRALQAALADPNSGGQPLANLVTQWREEHEKAKAKLGAARKDLTHVLTLRQEAVLCMAGIL